ncbi:uncharacterized protein LOC127530143 [Erpetoichthys calabaricus]|uniref:uncharacterized protein LOC127530143 n=1 Tax=Erpetoichthys calabaricus TaxID=27687 RepID=UPI0022342A05|nr:uncharacterized protein LOC127530143 [Erpetoichthys calabaricus]
MEKVGRFTAPTTTHPFQRAVLICQLISHCQCNKGLRATLHKAAWPIWTMCTTIMVITTLAIFFRRRFFNRVKPHPEEIEDKEVTKRRGHTTDSSPCS